MSWKSFITSLIELILKWYIYLFIIIILQPFLVLKIYS